MICSPGGIVANMFVLLRLVMDVVGVAAEATFESDP
jgi:hypothetical protein